MLLCSCELIMCCSWNNETRSFYKWSYRWHSSVDMVQQEIMIVKQEAMKTIEELKNAGMVHTGLKILHTFIIDILGRHTPAAKIFGSKSEEE